MGVAGFKIDFFDSQEAAMVSRINMYAEEAAKYHLILDFHGHYKPVGLNRTWPNVLNFEGVAGLENLKWAGSDFDMPRNDVILPFIRQAAGAMDYTPGALRNASKKEYRTVNERPMSQGTRAHQLACYVVFDEPFAMLCDSPSDYLKEDETTRWIASIPTVFDRTEILSAKIGEYVVTMREKDGKYYVGGLTNWDARELAVDTSFLPEGNWKWKIFMDGKNADTVGTDYVLGFFNSITKDKGSVTIPLAPGGGFVIVFEK
jgi:alpha-glucosidase